MTVISLNIRSVSRHDMAGWNGVLSLVSSIYFILHAENATVHLSTEIYPMFAHFWEHYIHKFSTECRGI
jgi:hypothetical protein